MKYCSKTNRSSMSNLGSRRKLSPQIKEYLLFLGFLFAWVELFLTLAMFRYANAPPDHTFWLWGILAGASSICLALGFRPEET
jgi:hypothetical protein